VQQAAPISTYPGNESAMVQRAFTPPASRPLAHLQPTATSPIAAALPVAVAPAAARTTPPTVDHPVAHPVAHPVVQAMTQAAPQFAVQTAPQTVTQTAEQPVVARIADNAPPQPEPVQRTAEAPVTPTEAPQPGTPQSQNPEELLRKLYDPLLRRLKADLWLDRERRGALTDL
jgi:hypothetical protein